MSDSNIPDGKFWARLGGVAAARREAAEIEGDKHAAEFWGRVGRIAVAIAVGALLLVPND